MDTLLQDIRYAVRALTKTPGLTLAAVVCLALGIGAVTTVYTATTALVLHPVPATDPGRLVAINESFPGADSDFDRAARGNYLDWRRESRSFDGLAAFSWWDVNVTGTAEPERVTGFLATPQFFTLLGARPMLGRTFTPEDAERGAHFTVVLSHALWQRKFGADRAVVGHTVMLNGETYTIAGVMPPEFIFPPGGELWAPLALTAADVLERRERDLTVFARLTKGTTIAAARAELRSVARRLADQYPATNARVDVRVEPMDRFYGRHPRPYLLLSLASVGFVLLIACANVANLQLARAASRAREVAVRAALGASRGRLVRQFLTESLLLALVGGALGALCALWGVLLLRNALPAPLVRFNPGWTRIVVDAPILGFTFLVATATGVVFGIVPALFGSKVNLVTSLKDGSRGTTGGARNGLRGALVIAEVALALVLLVSTGLMARSLAHLVNAPLGFRPERALTMELSLPPISYGDRARRLEFFARLLDRVQALPGVRSASLASVLPMTWNDWRRGAAIEGQPPVGPGQALPTVRYRVVSPGYFASVEIPLLRGRQFTERDDASSSRVAIVSAALAHRYWPGGDALGKRITLDSASGPREIVGISGDVRHNPNVGVDAMHPVMYVPLWQAALETMALVVRGSEESSARWQAGTLTGAIQREIVALDPGLAAGEVMAMEELVSNALAPQRVTAGMLGVFAGIALVMALVGIYGVMSYTVSRRTHEIGVRMALGAQRGDVMRIVLGRGSALAAAGIALGLAGALAMSRGLSSLLHGVGATDPVTFVAVPLVLGAVALSASWVPARRAAKVDPLVAMRGE